MMRAMEYFRQGIDAYWLSCVPVSYFPSVCVELSFPFRCPSACVCVSGSVSICQSERVFERLCVRFFFFFNGNKIIGN